MEIEIIVRGDEKSNLVAQGMNFIDGSRHEEGILKKNRSIIEGVNYTVEIYVDDHLVKRIDVDENGEYVNS